MMNKTLRQALILICTVALLPACGWLTDDKGAFRDRADDYRRAQLKAPLKLPQGTDGSVIQDAYFVPGIEDHNVLRGGFEVPRPDPLSKQVETGLVRIQALGKQRWILLHGGPGQVWPRLLGFLERRNFPVAYSNTVGGVVETKRIATPDTPSLGGERFRFRIEHGVQDNTSEIYVLQSTLPNVWPAVSTHDAREQAMVKVLAQYMADSSEGSSISMVADQGVGSKGKVSILRDRFGHYLKLDLGSERAWATLGGALRKSGFDVADWNVATGRYQAYYDPSVRPKLKETEEEAESPGWLSSLFGGGKTAQGKHKGVPYWVDMKRQSYSSQKIVIRRQDGKPMSEIQQETLLQLIKGNMS